MQSTKIAKLAVLVVLSLLFSGCATLDLGFSDEAEKSQEVVEPTVEIAPEDAQAEIALSPLEQKAQELKAQPNLYLASPSSIDNQAKRDYSEALKDIARGNIDDAAFAFSKMTTAYPKLSGPHLQLGDIAWTRYIATKDKDNRQTLLSDAQSHYQNAIKINANNYFAHNRLARIYREQGLFEQAKTHYETAIHSWPAFDKAYLNLGILYDLYLGDKASALAQYEIYQALQEKPVRKVRGWIADLNRQIAQQQTAATGAQE